MVEAMRLCAVYSLCMKTFKAGFVDDDTQREGRDVMKVELSKKNFVFLSPTLSLFSLRSDWCCIEQQQA
jgi:hypothetical protein